MRHSDNSYDQPPHHNRLVASVLFEESSGLEILRDLELGLRVSEELDLLEDESDIIWRWISACGGGL